MKLNIITATILSGLCLFSCAYNKAQYDGDDNLSYNKRSEETINLYVQENYPNKEIMKVNKLSIDEMDKKVQIISPGVYILEYTKGTNRKNTFGDQKYIRLSYDKYDLIGELIATTNKEKAKLLPEYHSYEYYGPINKENKLGSINVAIRTIVRNMQVGDRVRAVIPTWLNTSEEKKSEKDYFKEVKGSQNSIIDIYLQDSFNNLNEWESNFIEEYIKAKFGEKETGKIKHLTKNGKTLYINSENKNDVFISGTQIQFNYVARRLSDNMIFATNIKDTAYRYNLPISSSTPVIFNYDATEGQSKYYFSREDLYTDNDAKNFFPEGVTKGIQESHCYGKTTLIFSSDIGYGDIGLKGLIPANESILFDIYIEKFKK